MLCEGRMGRAALDDQLLTQCDRHAENAEEQKRCYWINARDWSARVGRPSGGGSVRLADVDDSFPGLR